MLLYSSLIQSLSLRGKRKDKEFLQALPSPILLKALSADGLVDATPLG